MNRETRDKVLNDHDFYDLGEITADIRIFEGRGGNAELWIVTDGRNNHCNWLVVISAEIKEDASMAYFNDNFVSVYFNNSEELEFILKCHGC